MKMKRCLSASILLMLSLEAAALLVAGHPSDAADVVGAIRLPSDTDTEVTAAATATARPWKCCDQAVCTKSIPPICRCLDEVERCAATCNRCAPSTMHRTLFVCKDQHVGDPGPICRPWKCCDVAECIKTVPLTCRCVDEVEQCWPTCKTCVASTSHPSRHVCNDSYRGSPGSMCNPPPNAAGN